MGKIAEISEVSVSSLKPYERNAKIHGKDQVEKIKKSILEFGFLSPCLIDRDLNIIAGHGRVLACKELGIEAVPCVFVEGLSEEQRRAYIIADNKLTELGGWDDELLNEELRQLTEAGFDIGVTGFELDVEPLESGSEDDTSVNPTAVLPESRIFVVSISAFGTNSECFIEAKLSQDEADHLLARFDQIQASDVVARLRGVINDL